MQKRPSALMGAIGLLLPVYGSGPNLLWGMGLEVTGRDRVRVIFGVCERFMNGPPMSTDERR